VPADLIFMQTPAFSHCMRRNASFAYATMLAMWIYRNFRAGFNDGLRIEAHAQEYMFMAWQLPNTDLDVATN
jgi:hypothetical protein